MFTGLIETIGEITAFSQENKSAVIGILPKSADFDCKIGDSVAINGVCLTIEKIESKKLYFRAVSETLSKTALFDAKVGQSVNLERAMPANGRLDGHIVLGHIDTVAKIAGIKSNGDSVLFTLEIPDEFAKFIAKKGSVAIDGISLTVADLTQNGTGQATCFILSIIPHSLKNTTLQYKKVGDSVNVECDVLARYIERMLNCGANTRENNDKKLMELLERGGF
jgi:riboflavin synthase